MIQTECKGCGQKLKLPDDTAGKKVRCPSCGDPVKVPLGATPMPSSQPPRPSTPPPAPRPPSVIPVAKPSAPPPPPSSDPFDFAASPASVNLPRAIPSRAQSPSLASTSADAPLVLAVTRSEPAPSRSHKAKPRSLAQQMATYAAILGAVAGAAILARFGPSDDAVTRVLGRLARGSLTVEHLRGAIIGLVGGLLIGSAIAGLAGRTWTSLLAVLLLAIGGSVYGAIRSAGEGELPWFLLLGGALCGAIVAAGLGGLLGWMIDMARR